MKPMTCEEAIAVGTALIAAAAVAKSAGRNEVSAENVNAALEGSIDRKIEELMGADVPAP